MEAEKRLVLMETMKYNDKGIAQHKIGYWVLHL